MTTLRTILLGAASVAILAPAGAQTMDPAQAAYQPPKTVQYVRDHDKRGINVFEVPKIAGATYDGFTIKWGAAFTQQFQGLSHENSADSVFVAAVNPSPGSAGSASVSDRNRLIEIGKGFNNATANLYMHAQVAPGVRISLTSYLSARHHNETWVKDGFIQIDESPIDHPLLKSMMQYMTVKIGHFEVNYGDFHFRRSDNGQAMYNPFVGNAIMDAFTTEVGAEAIFQRNGFLAVVALTNGEIRGNIARPADRDPAHMLKLGYDKQWTDDLRIRLTGSWRGQNSAISNTIYSGDRAGSRYYHVLENFKASESAQFTSGRVNPGFSDEMTGIMINPFIKFRGAEFFGMFETAKGRSAAETDTRDVKQLMAEGIYRFGTGESYFAGARWNKFDGDLGGANGDTQVERVNIGGGWFITPSLLMKAEWVDQKYMGFASTDIRAGGRFKGFMLEAVTAF